MQTLYRLMDNSIFIILFFISCLLDIVDFFIDGSPLESVVEEVSTYFFIAALLWEAVIWAIERFLKKPMLDPFRGQSWVKHLDVALAIIIGAEFLLNALRLVASGKEWAVWVGAGGIVVMTIIGVYVSSKLVKLVNEKESELADNRKNIERLRQQLGEKYSGLGEFLTMASATEGNPELFMSHFRAFFNVSGSDTMFGDVTEVVDEVCGGVLTRIKSECPEATHEDLVLCGLICLGFSPTAVALVFGNSKPSSIYNRRYRLRKHLCIPSEMNIETWLRDQMECNDGRAKA